ncbi:TPA: hypothetical protein U2R10_003840 [Proteus mirabilis]|uniref:hypothetical protein n=1 Tax=Morganella morganii TaxID=582 RepID=UPI0027960116|nr:hypothetical protein [Morganella morganii]WLV39862.1 hypothetical protein M2O45_04130 [Morganella morganii]HEM8846784.1 hypothetical protein [Proteus mirabilis]
MNNLLYRQNKMEVNITGMCILVSPKGVKDKKYEAINKLTPRDFDEYKKDKKTNKNRRSDIIIARYQFFL